MGRKLLGVTLAVAGGIIAIHAISLIVLYVLLAVLAFALFILLYQRM